jgi:IS30 family transposase
MEDPKINEAVRTALAQEWAPEQIAGGLQSQMQSRLDK